MNPRKFTRIALIFVTLVAGYSSAQPTPLSSDAQVWTVPYCDLIRNAASYDKKTVRVRAVYVAGFEGSLLYDSECGGEVGSQNQVWVKFDDSFEKSSKPEVIKKFRRLLKPSSKANNHETRMVEVVFVGKYDGVRQVGIVKLKDRELEFSVGYGHLDSYDYQLTVLSVEEVRAALKNAPW